MTEHLAEFIAKRAEIGTKELADVLGIKDSAVRMVCTGNYPNPSRILEQFARHYIDIVHCPHAGRTLERSDCKQRANGPQPFGGSAKLNWWHACQTCEHKS